MSIKNLEEENPHFIVPILAKEKVRDEDCLIIQYDEEKQLTKKTGKSTGAPARDE